MGRGLVRDIDFGEDRRALGALLAAVPTEMQSSLAKDAWDAIASAYIGSNRARRSTLQNLRQEGENLAFKPGEDNNDFVLCLNSLQQQLVRLNFEALKQLGNKEMLQGMPRVEHMEQFCDICVLTKQRRLPLLPRRSWGSCTATSAAS